MGLAHPTPYIEGEQFCGQMVCEIDNGEIYSETFGPYSSVSQVKSQFTRASRRLYVGATRGVWKSGTWVHGQITKVTPRYYMQEPQWEEITV